MRVFGAEACESDEVEMLNVPNGAHLHPELSLCRMTSPSVHCHASGGTQQLSLKHRPKPTVPDLL